MGSKGLYNPSLLLTTPNYSQLLYTTPNYSTLLLTLSTLTTHPTPLYPSPS